MISTGAKYERWEYLERHGKKFLCTCEDCVVHGYWQRRIRLAAEFATKSGMSPRWKRRNGNWKGAE